MNDLPPVPEVLIELLRAFGAEIDPKRLAEFFPAYQRMDPGIIQRVSGSAPFKKLCDHGFDPQRLLEYCATFHALSAIEKVLVSRRPALKRTFKHLEAAHKLLGDIPLEAAAGCMPISFPADLLALKRFIGHVLELARGPFSFAGAGKKGRPKEVARLNFMLRTAEVIPAALWEKGRRFESEFADLHAIVFFGETQANEESYGREHDRHLKVAVETATRTVRRRGREKVRAILPSDLRPLKNPENR
jgi:hypothetical protein